MAITYQQLLHNTAIRLSALVGTQAAAIAATYDTANLTAANFKSADWPFGAFRDAILMAEEDFAWAIADTANHPWRADLSSVTPALSDGEDVPGFDNNAVRIIGVYGSVHDAADGTVCLEAELDQITRIRRLQLAGTLTLPAYFYRMDGGRIRHTRTTVLIEVCAYNRSAQLVAFNANGSSLLPDVLEMPMTARAVALLTKETAFADQAQVYAKYAEEALIRIRGGLTSVVGKAMPLSAGESA